MRTRSNYFAVLIRVTIPGDIFRQKSDEVLENPAFGLITLNITK
jgi:hypothetical protein